MLLWAELVEKWAAETGLLAEETSYLMRLAHLACLGLLAAHSDWWAQDLLV